MNDDFLQMSVNYEKVANSCEYSPIIRMTALQLQKNPYMTVGDFFQQLGNNDIYELSKMVDKVHSNEIAAQQLLLLSEMLSRAEGTESGTVDGCAKNLSTLCTFIICVSLARKGMVRVFYENLSFGEDMAARVIVEKL